MVLVVLLFRFIEIRCRKRENAFSPASPKKTMVPHAQKMEVHINNKCLKCPEMMKRIVRGIVDDEGLSDQQSDESALCDTPSASSSISIKRRKCSKTLNEIADERLDLMKVLVAQSSDKKLNDMDYYFVGVSRSVSKLSPELQIEAKEEIAKLVAKLERKNLENCTLIQQ